MAIRNPGPGAPPPKTAQSPAPNPKNATSSKQSGNAAKNSSQPQKSPQPAPQVKATPAAPSPPKPQQVATPKQSAPIAANPTPVEAPVAMPSETPVAPSVAAMEPPALQPASAAPATASDKPPVAALANPPMPDASPAKQGGATKAPVDAMAIDASGLQKSFMKIAEQGLNQSRAALEQATSAANEASLSLGSSLQASSKGAADLTVKAFEMVGASAVAAFDHMVALSSMKTMSDAIALHGAFLRKQSEMALAHAKEFSELAKKAATFSTASLQKGKNS